MPLSAKVLVVGGGPAGATAARRLAEHGKDIILLEKNLSHNKPCGGGLALKAFDEFGLPKTVVKKEVHGLRLFSPKGEAIEIGLRDNRLAIVARKEFDQMLRLTAREQGARIIEGEFLKIRDDKKCIVEAFIEGKRVEIVSEYIIAADGVNSRVRTSLGIKPAPSLLTASETVTGPDMDYCEFWFDAMRNPYSYSWVFPAPEGVSVGTGCFEPKGINTLLLHFKERTGRMGTGKKKIYRIPVWDGRLYHKNKILFAGDSAGQVLPLSYEGIYYALKAGELAAEAILEGKAAHYKKKWKSRFQKKFSLLTRLQNFFLKDNASAEKLVALHRRPEVQEVSLMLWLDKGDRHYNLLNYLKLFGKFLR
ncbi:MAG: geranylgeranyl reductase family protein [Deltaproteobacteria bacterium]|nr:geranylgeranyl reductase family protein [Deltaproteobacteria bacterium]